MTRPISLRPRIARSSLLELCAGSSPRSWIAVLCLFCGLAITLLSWVNRSSMNPDGISYLDMADQLLKGDLRALLHPYWSPLYPCLLAFAMKVFSPTPPGDILLVHLVNCFIGLSALASFTFFVSQWSRLRGIDRDSADSMSVFRLHTGFAYVLFLWSISELIGLVTPDLCVAALVYLTAGLCCRLASLRHGWGTSASLGIALSLAYFSKAAMLPLGVALLVLLAIPRICVLPRRLSVVIGALVFVILIGPYVFLLSHHQHRLTFGDAGRLNYAWLVQREIPMHAGWIGQPTGTGNPMHPLQVFRVAPTVLEFRNTVPGTYPLWYDPAYFHEGLQVRFDVRKQVMVLLRSSESFIVAHGHNLSPLLAGIAVLGAFALRRRLRIDFSRSWLILWSLTAFSMFALVDIQARYILPFIVLFWITVYETFSPGMRAFPPLAHRAVISVTTVCILLSQLLYVGSEVIHSTRQLEALNSIVVAKELARLGLRPGDTIATAGVPWGLYYARLARLRVIASIGFRGGGDYQYDTEQLWRLSDGEFNAVKEELRRIGAKAIVSSERCNDTANAGWHSISDTEYCVQLLYQ